MKTRPDRFLMMLLAFALLVLAGGCAHPSLTPGTAQISAARQAPARVYHKGHWLHYHSSYYRYRQDDRWVIARSVPGHVARFHRPPSQVGGRVDGSPAT